MGCGLTHGMRCPACIPCDIRPMCSAPGSLPIFVREWMMFIAFDLESLDALVRAHLAYLSMLGVCPESLPEYLTGQFLLLPSLVRQFRRMPSLDVSVCFDIISDIANSSEIGVQQSLVQASL